MITKIKFLLCNNMLLFVHSVQRKYPMNEAIPQNAIHQAAFEGDVKRLREFLAQNPALVSELHSVDQAPPIVHALSGGHCEAVAVLLEANSPLNYVDKSNKKVLMHFLTPTEKGEKKKNRELLLEKMFKKARDYKWHSRAPVHESTSGLIIILLNLILCFHFMRNFSAKRKMLEELTIQMKTLVSHSEPFALNELGDVYSLVGNICIETQAVTDAFKYYQSAIHFYTKPIELTTKDEDRLLFIINMTKIYKELLEKLQEATNPIALLSVIEEKIDVHRRLQILVQDFPSPLNLLQPHLVELKEAQMKFYQEIKILRAKAPSPMPKVSLYSSATDKLKRWQKDQSVPRSKRPHEGPVVSKPYNLPKVPPLTLQWRGKSVSVSLADNSKQEETKGEQQSPSKKVRFDLS
jgi:hypothetical protein